MILDAYESPSRRLFHMLYRLSPDLKFQTGFTLPQKKDAQSARQRAVNNQ